MPFLVVGRDRPALRDRLGRRVQWEVRVQQVPLDRLVRQAAQVQQDRRVLLELQARPELPELPERLGLRVRLALLGLRGQLDQRELLEQQAQQDRLVPQE